MYSQDGAGKKESTEDLDQETLLIEDISSGHTDIITTLKSRTLVRNMISFLVKYYCQ